MSKVNMRSKQIWLIFQITVFGLTAATNDFFNHTSYGLNTEVNNDNRNLQIVHKENLRCKMTSSVKCEIADTGKECGTLVLLPPEDCKPTDFIFTFRFCSKESKHEIKLLKELTTPMVYGDKVPGVKQFKKQLLKTKECRRKTFTATFNPCDRRYIFASLKVEGKIPTKKADNYCYSFAWYSIEPKIIDAILKPVTLSPTIEPSLGPTVATPGLSSGLQCFVNGVAFTGLKCEEYINQILQNSGGRRTLRNTSRSLYSNNDPTDSRLEIEGLTSLTNVRDEPIHIKNYKVTINEVVTNMLAEGEVLILQPFETYTRSGFLDLLEYSGKPLDLEVYADGFGMKSNEPVSTTANLGFHIP